MKKEETIYLDTTVPSAYCDERVRERQKETVNFWNNILPDYQVYISEITIKELEETPDITLKRKLRNLVKDFKILKTNNEIRNLAKAYLERGIFPEKYIDDALHVATASFYSISYVVSWNFAHLVKVKTRKWVNSVNILEEYQKIEIISPQEL